MGVTSEAVLSIPDNGSTLSSPCSTFLKPPTASRRRGHCTRAPSGRNTEARYPHNVSEGSGDSHGSSNDPLRIPVSYMLLHCMEDIGIGSWSGQG